MWGKILIVLFTGFLTILFLADKQNTMAILSAIICVVTIWRIGRERNDKLRK